MLFGSIENAFTTFGTSVGVIAGYGGNNIADLITRVLGAVYSASGAELIIPDLEGTS